MKKQRHHLTKAERDELVDALRAGETDYAALAQRFRVKVHTVQGFAGLLRQREGKPEPPNVHWRSPKVHRTCARARCDARVSGGERLCEQHRVALPVLPDSGFVKPPTLAQLMGRR